MTIVELHVANELLADFEAIRNKIEGREVGRQPSPVSNDVTVLSMEMDGAPPHAKTMELVMELADGQARVKEIYYWDEHGIFIAPEVPFPKP
jgi:hypothetical protein